MKSIEMIQNCNSLEELVNEIKGGKSKTKSFFKRIIRNINYLFTKSTTSRGLLTSVGSFVSFLFLLSVKENTAIPNTMSVFYKISVTLLLGSIMSGLISILGFAFDRDKAITSLICLSFISSISLITMLLFVLNVGWIAGLIPITIFGLGFFDLEAKTTIFKKEREESNNLSKAEKRAEQLNILSKWLKDQEEKIVESLKERKSSIRNLKDQLQKYLNTLESKSRDDFLSSKYGENINGRIEIIENQLSSVELSLKSLEEKERVMTQAIEETINNILPEFRKEQEFLQEMIEIDQVLDKADTEISETKELIRSIDQNFISMFTKVNSALEQASVMNQALIEVTNDDFKNINRISEPIESFDIDELQEVVSSTRLKVHS